MRHTHRPARTTCQALRLYTAIILIGSLTSDNFGPTAIVPGFKQMVVSVGNRRRSTGASLPVSSPLSSQSGGLRGSSVAAASDVAVEEVPVYDPASPLPVHPLILGLIQTFFDKLGCNYPFLKRAKFMRMVMEKRVEGILVDSICAIAARFSDAQQLSGGNDKMPRTERGQVFAQRAKLATVETFPCPSVGAVQAMLLMAYEGFGANQDSALWMYLGLAIRMAVDLGLQKRIGIQYQGDKDPWYITQKTRDNGDSESPEDRRPHDSEDLRLGRTKGSRAGTYRHFLGRIPSLTESSPLELAGQSLSGMTTSISPFQCVQWTWQQDGQRCFQSF